MEAEFSAQPTRLSLSECERLIGRGSRDVETLSRVAGWHSLPGQAISVPLGYAVNMLVLSIAKDCGVEPQSMAAYLPGLRNEALLKLGEDIESWSYLGPEESRQFFLTRLYGDTDSVRPRIASLLGCCLHTTTRYLRFHSQANVECLTNSEVDSPKNSSTPRFVIDAHDLACRLQAVCGRAMFTLTARATLH